MKFHDAYILHMSQSSDPQQKNHNAHTAFRIKTDRSSYLSPLIMMLHAVFLYIITWLNSCLPVRVIMALFVVIVAVSNDLIQPFYSKNGCIAR